MRIAPANGGCYFALGHHPALSVAALGVAPWPTCSAARRIVASGAKASRDAVWDVIRRQHLCGVCISHEAALSENDGANTAGRARPALGFGSVTGSRRVPGAWGSTLTRSPDVGVAVPGGAVRRVPTPPAARNVRW